MKLRRRHHPERTGQKSAPSATAGKRIAPKIMTSQTTQFYNHAGELIDTEKLQAEVMKNTKLHEEMCKLSGVPAWKLLRQQMENFIGAGPIASDRVPSVFNDMMRAQGKNVRIGKLEKSQT